MPGIGISRIGTSASTQALPTTIFRDYAQKRYIDGLEMLRQTSGNLILMDSLDVGMLVNNNDLRGWRGMVDCELPNDG